MGKTTNETIEEMARATNLTVRFEEWLVDHPGGTIEEFVQEDTPRD